MECSARDYNEEMNQRFSGTVLESIEGVQKRGSGIIIRKKVNKMSSTLLCIGHPLHGKTLFRIGFFHSFHSHIDPSFSFLFLCSLLGLFKRERKNNMFRSQCIPFSLALYNPIHRSSCFSFSCAML